MGSGERYFLEPTANRRARVVVSRCGPRGWRGNFPTRSARGLVDPPTRVFSLAGDDVDVVMGTSIDAERTAWRASRASVGLRGRGSSCSAFSSPAWPSCWPTSCATRALIARAGHHALARARVAFALTSFFRMVAPRTERRRARVSARSRSVLRHQLLDFVESDCTPSWSEAELSVPRQRPRASGRASDALHARRRGEPPAGADGFCLRPAPE